MTSTRLCVRQPMTNLVLSLFKPILPIYILIRMHITGLLKYYYHYRVRSVNCKDFYGNVGIVLSDFVPALKPNVCITNHALNYYRCTCALSVRVGILQVLHIVLI